MCLLKYLVDSPNCIVSNWMRYFTKGLCIKKLENNFLPRYIVYDLLANALLQQGISEPVFYVDLVYKFKIIVEKPVLVINSKKIIKRYKKIL